MRRKPAVRIGEPGIIPARYSRSFFFLSSCCERARPVGTRLRSPFCTSGPHFVRPSARCRATSQIRNIHPTERVRICGNAPTGASLPSVRARVVSAPAQWAPAALTLSLHFRAALRATIYALPRYVPHFGSSGFGNNPCRRNRDNKRGWFLRVSSCSQIRRTRQPARRRVPITRRSRAWLRAILVCQNSALVLGCVAWIGHPCQKHPSTKTMSRSFRKTKSGLPKTAAFRRQPVMPCARNTAINRSSVEPLPEPRTLAMSEERRAFVMMSAMDLVLLTSRLKANLCSPVHRVSHDFPLATPPPI